MARAPFQVLVLPYRIVENGEFEYCIFKRSDDNYWQGIAGGGEEGESPLDAAKREANEEANVPFTAKYSELDTKASIPVYHFAARDSWPKDLYIVNGYSFAVEYTGFDILLSSEHVEFKWVSFEEADSLLYWENNKTALWELHQRLLDGTLK